MTSVELKHFCLKANQCVAYKALINRAINEGVSWNHLRLGVETEAKVHFPRHFSSQEIEHLTHSLLESIREWREKRQSK